MEIQELRGWLESGGKVEPEAKKPEAKPLPGPEIDPDGTPEMGTGPGRLTGSAIEEFIFAGNAIFTIRNTKTGNRFTYRFRKAKDKGDGRPLPYFVSVLTGSDNENNYSYIGFINRRHFVYGGAKARVKRDAQSVKAFEWFYAHIGNLGPVEVFHEGRCGRCGRTLTVPESIERGIGPECDKIRNNLS